MKTYCKDIVQLPTYAAAPMISGEYYGMNKEDKRNIAEFLRPYYNMAKQLKDGDIIIDLVDPQADSYFSWHPAFGLPCTAYDCYIQVAYTERQDIAEKQFAPDIKLTLNEFDIITKCDSISANGDKFLLGHVLIGTVYQEILKDSHKICFEVVREE